MREQFSPYYCIHQSIHPPSINEVSTFKRLYFSNRRILWVSRLPVSMGAIFPRIRRTSNFAMVMHWSVGLPAPLLPESAQSINHPCYHRICYKWVISWVFSAVCSFATINVFECAVERQRRTDYQSSDHRFKLAPLPLTFLGLCSLTVSCPYATTSP